MDSDATSSPDLHEQVRAAAPIDLNQLAKEEMEALGRRCQKLITKDARIQMACSVLVESQRLYNIALNAVNRRIDELEESSQVESFLIRSMQHQAGKVEVDRKDTLVRLQRQVVPWLAAEAQEALMRAGQVVTEAETQDNEKRRGISLPSPWFFTASEDGAPVPTLPREKILTLVGAPVVVQYVLNNIVSCVVAGRYPDGFRPNVLRLRDCVREHTNITPDPDQSGIEVGVNRWLDCGRTPKATEETLRPWLRQFRKRRVDLLVIDDLSQGISSAPSLPPQAIAGNCHRNFKRWADEVGAAVVAGLPLGRDRPVDQALQDVTKLDATWTQLEIYTTLVFLNVKHEEGEYHLVASRHLDPQAEIRLAGPWPELPFSSC